MSVFFPKICHLSVAAAYWAFRPKESFSGGGALPPGWRLEVVTEAGEGQSSVFILSQSHLADKRFSLPWPSGSLPAGRNWGGRVLPGGEGAFVLLFLHLEPVSLSS